MTDEVKYIWSAYLVHYDTVILSAHLRNQIEDIVEENFHLAKEIRIRTNDPGVSWLALAYGVDASRRGWGDTLNIVLPVLFGTKKLMVSDDTLVYMEDGIPFYFSDKKKDFMFVIKNGKDNE